MAASRYQVGANLFHRCAGSRSNSFEGRGLLCGRKTGKGTKFGAALSKQTSTVITGSLRDTIFANSCYIARAIPENGIARTGAKSLSATLVVERTVATLTRVRIDIVLFTSQDFGVAIFLSCRFMAAQFANLLETVD
jgi:hypothetical protein